MSLLDKLKKNKHVKDTVYTRDKEEEKEFISTGCLTLNILFSGRLNGGIAVGKMSQIAAPSSLGKSFVGLKVARNAQKKGMSVIYLDTEFAFDYEFADSVGLDSDELLVIQDNQFESARKTIMNIFEDLDKEERTKVLFIIDSWGGLVTSKTVEDSISGKDVSDMTISKKKNSFARLITGLGTTVFVVNQTYECQTGESLVRTEDGVKSLKDIQVGDNVLTYSGLQPVLNKVQYEDTPTYDIELDNGDIFSVTERHRFFCNVDGENKWLQAGELTPDIEILTVEENGLVVPE